MGFAAAGASGAAGAVGSPCWLDGTLATATTGCPRSGLFRVHPTTWNELAPPTSRCDGDGEPVVGGRVAVDLDLVDAGNRDRDAVIVARVAGEVADPGRLVGVGRPHVEVGVAGYGGQFHIQPVARLQFVAIDAPLVGRDAVGGRPVVDVGAVGEEGDIAGAVGAPCLQILDTGAGQQRLGMIVLGGVVVEPPGVPNGHSLVGGRAVPRSTGVAGAANCVAAPRRVGRRQRGLGQGITCPAAHNPDFEPVVLEFFGAAVGGQFGLHATIFAIQFVDGGLDRDRSGLGNAHHLAWI